MSMIEEIELPVFTLEQMRAAREESARTHQNVCKVLEDALALPPQQFTAVLGATLNVPVLRM